MKQIAPKALPRAFRETLYTFSLPKPDAHILIAYSGGADSTALLHLFHALAKSCKHPPRISALHVHHGIRGAEADRDALHCERFCRSLGIPFTVVFRDVPALAWETGQTLEEAARSARYDAITAHLAAHSDITHVATAHHADDQAETVLFRMLRGTALHGLSGIPAVRTLKLSCEQEQRNVLLIRPLLDIPSPSLRAYLDHHAIAYVTDSTNAENDASRNLLRNTLIPCAEQINSAFSDALLRLSKQAEEDESYFCQKTAQFLHDHHVKVTEAEALCADSTLPTDALRAEHIAIRKRLLAMLYSAQQTTGQSDEKPLHHTYLDAMLAALANGSATDLPHGLRFSVGADVCKIHPKQDKAAPQDYRISLSVGEAAALPSGEICFLCDNSVKSSENLQDLKNIYKLFISTHINSDTLLEDLYLRPRHDNASDRYLCGHKTTLVRDALSSHRVPQIMRASIPLFCDRDGILWVPFCGIRDDINPRLTPCQHTYELYYFYQERS